jgi:transglutaminase-like putative cysteine protease
MRQLFHFGSLFAAGCLLLAGNAGQAAAATSAPGSLPPSTSPAAAASPAPATPALPPPAAERSFEITYRARVDGWPPGSKRVEIWIPYPHSDAHQRVEVLGVQAPAPYEVTTEHEFGNQVLHLSLEQPQTPIEIVLRARVERRAVVRRDLAKAAAKGHPQRDPALARWLQPDRLVPLDARIRDLAADVTAGKRTDVEKARAIYDYVVDTMSYDKQGTGWGEGDIYWACDTKRGNCTDFHALFTGLTRAAGIPAKFDIGLPIPPERGAGKIAGYHCWSEFWLDGYGWVPVDASEARKHPERREYYFGNHDPDRVQLTEGRDLVLSPAQHGKPLNYFVYPYVEVDGQPFAEVERELDYRDLEAPTPARR